MTSKRPSQRYESKLEVEEKTGKREINDRNPRTYNLNGEVEEREAKREGGKPN